MPEASGCKWTWASIVIVVREEKKTWQRTEHMGMKSKQQRAHCSICINMQHSCPGQCFFTSVLVPWPVEEVAVRNRCVINERVTDQTVDPWPGQPKPQASISQAFPTSPRKTCLLTMCVCVVWGGWGIPSLHCNMLTEDVSSEVKEGYLFTSPVWQALNLCDRPFDLNIQHWGWMWPLYINSPTCLHEK